MSPTWNLKPFRDCSPLPTIIPSRLRCEVVMVYPACLPGVRRETDSCIQIQGTCSVPLVLPKYSRSPFLIRCRKDTNNNTTSVDGSLLLTLRKLRYHGKCIMSFDIVMYMICLHQSSYKMQPSINKTKICQVISFLAAGCTANLQGDPN